MNPTRLRLWIRRYGNAGILLVGGYLAWRHLCMRWRMAVVICLLVFLAGLAGFLLRARPHKPLSRKTDAPIAPVVSAARLDATLLAAVRNNNFTAVSTTLRAGANVNAADSEGNTALILAAEHASEDIVRVLLQYAPHVNATDRNEATAVWFAINYNRIGVVRLLLAKGADVGEPALLGEVAAAGNDAMLRLLLAHGARANTVYDILSRTALMDAAENHHLATIDLLLAHGANINECSRFGTALTFAAAKGDLSLVRFLVSRGADVNARDAYGTVLEDAVEHPDVVRFLARHGAKVDLAGKWDTTPLMIAARDGNLASVNILLQHGANVNYISEYQEQTPLELAAEKGQVKVVKTLLRWGAKVNLRSKQEEDGIEISTTALQKATKAGQTEVVRLLKRAGARE